LDAFVEDIRLAVRHQIGKEQSRERDGGRVIVGATFDHQDRGARVSLSQPRSNNAAGSPAYVKPVS